jgi:energy-converting hydrogenase Eha subunit E
MSIAHGNDVRLRSRARTVSASPIIRAVAAALGVSGLLVMLTWTMLTDASHLVDDFSMDAWLMEHQAASLRHDFVPSLTLTSAEAAFHPTFAFYGGTLFVVGGAITSVVGSAIAAEIIVYLLALAAAYGGWLWLARMAGVRSWPAHAPAILYVTAPYMLTNINVRQDLTEVVATAAIPPLLASGLSVLRADRLRGGPVAVLAASTIAFGGSHNLTLLWGTTILVIAGSALAAAVPQARRHVTKRGVLRVLAVVIPATAVNAWWLFPDLAYHSDTVIAHRIDEWKALLRGPHPEVGVKNLFALGHPSVAPGLVLTLPVLAMGWVVIAAFATREQWRETWGRTLAVLTFLTVGILVVMAHPSWILALPDPWLMIQFSFRLMTYVLFGICGAVIAALVLVNRSAHRWPIALLLPILVISVIGAAVQRHDAPRGNFSTTVHIDRFLTFNTGDFADGGLPQMSPGYGAKVMSLSRTGVTRSHIAADASAAPGDVLYTSLLTPARMLDVQGARIIGRWAGQPSGPGWQVRWGLVLQIDRDATPGKAHIVIREARSLPILGGQLISLLGLLGLAANAVVIASAARRRRRARPTL